MPLFSLCLRFLLGIGLGLLPLELLFLEFESGAVLSGPSLLASHKNLFLGTFIFKSNPSQAHTVFAVLDQWEKV